MGFGMGAKSAIVPNDQKFRELILYVAELSEKDVNFGMTKLNKLLFDIDFSAYGQTGTPVTGQEYQALPKGPCARKLKPTVTALIRSKDAAIKRVPRGFIQERVVALRKPDLSLFTGEEIALVNEVIEQHWELTATDISEASHNFAGWQVANERETIPYHTVFRSYRKLTPQERQHGAKLGEARRKVSASS